MRIQEIVTVPSLILRKKAEKVTIFDVELQNLAKKMVEMMRQYDGVGLAAPQIGISKRIIVLEYDPQNDDKTRGDKPFPLTVLTNPTITKYSKEQIAMAEGCLSLPGIEIDVKRPKEVNVAAQDLDGKPVKIRAKGLLARVIQHEIDHLNGILFTDHAKDVKNLKHYVDLRCIFMGTPDFAVPALEALLVNNVNIVGVITETDKPVGRKQEMTAPIVKTVAEDFGLPVHQPNNKLEVEEIVKELQPDYIVVAAYGKMLTKNVLDFPDFGVINIHPSMLPKYRGATPMQNAILNGDKKTGITIMKLTEGMDEGPIVFQKQYEIFENENYEELSQRLSIEGARILIQTLPMYLSNQWRPVEQDSEKATYTKLTKKEDGEINWEKSAEEIVNMIRAYYPWPKTTAWLTDNRQLTTDKKTRLIIHTAHVENDKVVPEMVQLEGKNPTNWEDFRHGWQGELPEILK